jgi:hypothetical protein
LFQVLEMHSILSDAGLCPFLRKVVVDDCDLEPDLSMCEKIISCVLKPERESALHMVIESYSLVLAPLILLNFSVEAVDPASTAGDGSS